MQEQINRRWLIQDRPLGRALRDSDFRLDSAPVSKVGDGQVMLRTLYLGFRLAATVVWPDNQEPGSVAPGTGVVPWGSGAYLISGTSTSAAYTTGTAAGTAASKNIPIPNVVQAMLNSPSFKYFGPK